MTRLLQSPWTASLLGLVAYLASMILFWRPQCRPDKPLYAQITRALTGPSWNFQNPEVDLLIQELKSEKESLAAREKALKDLEARLQSERNELYSLTQTVFQVQAEFDKCVIRIKEQESANLRKLAKTYAAMNPQAAAAVFKALDEETLIKVLTCMRETETAAIMEVIAKQSDADAKRVATLSERIRLALPDPKKNSP